MTPGTPSSCTHSRESATDLWTTLQHRRHLANPRGHQAVWFIPRLALLPRPREGLLSPRELIDWVLSVLEQVLAALTNQTVQHRSPLSCILQNDCNTHLLH